MLVGSAVGWDLSGSSPIAEWSKKVAELRNRVVHGAYVPTFSESGNALSAVHNLVSYLCDRLSSDRVIRLYPRTCFVLVGPPGLERRGVESRHIQDLLARPGEPPWDETFARWKAALQRIRRDRLAAPRLPSEDGAYLLAVVTPDGELRWCLHDRRVAMAAAMEVQESDIPEPTRRGLDRLVQEVRASRPVDPVSLAPHDEALPTFTRIGQWVEEYHLVPMAGVMVDRSDFDRSFTDRPGGEAICAT